MEELSLIIQLFALVLVVVISCILTRRWVAMTCAVFIMLLTNIVAQIIVAGEGPGACVGFVALPLYGVGASWLTFKLRRVK